MGFMGALLGTTSGNTGSAGMNYKAENDRIASPIGDAQTEQDRAAAIAAQKQQGDFINATAAQNGLGNQTSVYNQLQGVTNGTGPNPAQAQLAQATGANVSNQTAMMAGQRGASGNPALMARLAAQQGAATQQQSAGQAASMQASQSLNALNSQGSMANQMVSQQQGAVNAYANTATTQYQNDLGARGAFNNALVGQQSSQNAANAAVAGQTAQGQGKMVGGIMNMAGSMMSSGGAQGGVVPAAAGGGKIPTDKNGVQYMYDGGMSDVPNVPTDAQMAPSMDATQTDPGLVQDAQVGGAYTADQQQSPSGDSFVAAVLGGKSPDADQATNQPAAQQKTDMQKMGAGLQAFGSAFGAQGTAPTTAAKDAKGTSATGDLPPPTIAAPIAVQMQGPDDWGKSSSTSAPGGSGGGGGGGGGMGSMMGGGGEGGGGMGSMAMMAAKGGGKVPVMLSPGEKYLKPEEAKAVAAGKKDPMEGRTIPGKAAVKGNSLKNDTVATKLEPGGVVIPRSVMNAKDPAKEAAKFVAAVLAKNALISDKVPTSQAKTVMKTKAGK